MARSKRKLQEINAASMADIAFMLLIFFLVATTMDIDSGLYRVLPPMPDEQQLEDQDNKIKERNVFVVLVNRNDDLLVEGEPLRIDQLREKTKEFLKNEDRKEILPEMKIEYIEPFGEIEVTKGIISLQNDIGTSYKTYLAVMNELLAAGNEIKDEFSLARFGKKYDDITADQRDAVRDAVPCIISEAEPKKIGGD